MKIFASTNDDHGLHRPHRKFIPVKSVKSVAMKSVVIIFGAGFSVLFPAAFLSLCPAGLSERIEIRAQQLNGFDLQDPSRCRFGDLEFRGGLILSSSHPSFGGISAFHIQPDGAWFLGATDRGVWLRGRIVYDGNRPAGIADAEMEPILGSNGKPSGRWDAEALATNGGILYLGIERINSVFRFDYDGQGFPARAQPVAIPSAIKKWPGNQSIEAMVLVPKGYPLGGALIVLSEQAVDEFGNLEAFLIGGPKPGRFTVKRSDDFDISDAAFLPTGDLLVLERKYSFEFQASMRIRRIPLEDIKPGALVDGPVLIEADRHFQIDNMEAIDVHRASSGEILLTLVSDDNFSSAQRTILLQFALLKQAL